VLPKLVSGIKSRFWFRSSARNALKTMEPEADLTNPPALTDGVDLGPRTGSSRQRRFELLKGERLRAWAASVEKPKNDLLVKSDGSLVARTNEDRFLLMATESRQLLVAVSDGAGGQGLYCGDWAERLLNELPHDPLPTADAVNEWLGAFWKDFQTEFKERARPDPFLHRKLINEGSNATLTAAWVRSDGEGTKLSAVLSGDSPIFICNFSGHPPALRLLHPINANAFLRDPYLINWREAVDPDKLQILTDIPIAYDDTIILASDGIGQYLLLRSLYGISSAEHTELTSKLFHEVEQIRENQSSKFASMANAHSRCLDFSFADEIHVVRNGFNNVREFAEFIGDRLEKGLLPNDDATLAVIDVT
jgi:serine/threonine protein phosphatase PrpC